VQHLTGLSQDWYRQRRPPVRALYDAQMYHGKSRGETKNTYSIQKHANSAKSGGNLLKYEGNSKFSEIGE